MQFRKIAAVAGSALLAGATLATAGIAATVNTVGEITSKLGTPEEGFPMFVVGANAAASDVAAAIDIAVRLAANSKTTEPVQVTTAETTVTGGYLLETETNKLHYNDAINKAIQILTAKEINDLLASDTVEDENGQKYNYDQYLRIGGRTIVYDQPTSTEKDPVFFVQLGTTSANYLVQAEVVFDNALNVTKAKGKKITLFGQEFTIAPESTSSKLVLYKSSDKVTINAGETATLSVGDQSYTAEVIGIVDSSKAVVKINGVTKEVTEGNSYDFGGVNVYIEDVFYYKVPTETGNVVLSAGADKYIFQDGQSVKTGANEESIKGTEVSFTNSPGDLSKMVIKFFAPDSNSAYIKAGETWTDPVFGTIKVAFNGLDSTSTEEIRVEPASTDAYRAAFTDKNGNSASVEFAYVGTSPTDGTVELQDSNGYDYVVVEGGAVGENDYTVLAAASGFERLVQVTDISVEDATTIKVKLKDVIDGTEFEVTANQATGNYIYGTKVIDGQEYTFAVDKTSNNTVAITYDSGAGAANTGTYKTIYPGIQTSKGAYVFLAEPVTLNDAIANATGSITYQFIGGRVYFREKSDGTVLQYSTDGSTWTDISAANNVLVNITVAGVTYQFQVDSVGTSGNSNIDSVKIQGVTKPAVVIVEEKDSDDNQNAVIVSIQEDTTNSRLDVEAIDMTDANAVEQETTSDTYTKKYVDTYGVQITQSGIDGQDNVAITYPDNQLVAKVAVGSNPVFGTATSEVTRDVVVPVTTDIAKLDTEVDDTMKQNYDLVVVGGPCVNRVAAELLGDETAYMSSPACDDLFTNAAGENAALVKVFPDFYAEGKTAVLVAGWNREATKKAATMLQAGDLDQYTSQAVRIVDSSVEEITVEEQTTEETTQ